MTAKPNGLPTLIILTQREHQRLTNKVKRLQTWALDLDTLQQYRVSWATHLGFVDYLPSLLQAMDQLIYHRRQGLATEADYEEVVFQVGVYKKATGAFIRRFFGSINPYVDRWLKPLPMVRYTFEKHYELHRRLTVAEQGALMRELIEAIPNQDDPYRLRQHPEGRAILDELGILDEARQREAEPMDKARTGKVVDFQAFRNRHR